MAAKGIVKIADYDPMWPAIYAKERDRILVATENRLLAIEHVGSTAVPGFSKADNRYNGRSLETLRRQRVYCAP